MNLRFLVCRLAMLLQGDHLPGSTMLLKNEGKILAGNQLLDALPRAEYQRLLPSLEPVTLALGEIIAEPGAAIKYVYFPCDVLLLSLLTIVDGTRALEVALVGREGMIGVAVALGAGFSSKRATVQRAGVAVRIRVAQFRREVRGDLALRREVLFYTHLLMVQIAHTAACDRFLPIEARLAHRLLVTRDRMGSNHFSLTHEFLGQMLGVRRAGVTAAAHALKVRHLIDYSRGNIAIIDGPGLEAIAGSCYTPAKGIHAKL